MKKFIITSPTFSGEIHVLYGLDWKLLLIDFLKCDLTEEQMQYFKDKLPVALVFPELANPNQDRIELLTGHFGKSKLNIIQEGYFVSFEQFWTRYNVKHNRARCEKLWQKMTDADKVNAFFKLGMYDRHLALNQWKTKADPDTYLRNRYWDNEWK